MDDFVFSSIVMRFHIIREVVTSFEFEISLFKLMKHVVHPSAISEDFVAVVMVCFDINQACEPMSSVIEKPNKSAIVILVRE